MKNNDKKIVIFASILAALTIAIGAFGAHGLKELVDDNALKSFETGVRYQMYHVLAILVIGLSSMVSEKTKKVTTILFVLGIILFSGSIYFLSLDELLSINAKSIGFVTPLGGLCFIIGWIILGYRVFNNK